ncbi:hypothetical protein HIM_05838 [Hirsutella minnesotensis 3608]|uniref:Peptidase M43 pregnancy-associated plasma-A domain-containing protein n=1 Tax=Hirsutella minnesotensis 3608 TaxID=1043627 RepID=A0A0F7ZJV8_9HYPO|nr:hypothetical protein HIM_05838 [Hirsutella minnesotensis 3608]
MLHVKLLPLLALTATALSVGHGEAPENDAETPFCGMNSLDNDIGGQQASPDFQAFVPHDDEHDHATPAALSSNDIVADDGAPIQVTTSIVVVARRDDIEKGHIETKNIDKQLHLLNEAFEPANISFVPMQTQYYTQPSWFDEPDRSVDQKKRMLRAMVRRGDYKTLNIIYIPEFAPNSSVVGDCYYPQPLDRDFGLYYYDSCMLRTDLAPNVDARREMSGAATIHEVGHWFNLPHFGSSGCAAGSQGQCPGSDALNNYMFPFKT